MASFLGVPIKVRDEVNGNLYLTDKIGWSEFTAQDEVLVGALVLGAGIAIKNTRLHQRVQQVAVYDDRDRMARDMHENVIQRLFAAGLSLQAMAGVAASAGVTDRLQRGIDDLDETIWQIRSTIYELGSSEVDVVFASASSLSCAISLRWLDLMSGLHSMAMSIMTSDQLAEHLVAVIREAVTSVGRHAHAIECNLSVNVKDGACRLQVTDNGRGFDDPKRTRGDLASSTSDAVRKSCMGSSPPKRRKAAGLLSSGRCPSVRNGAVLHWTIDPRVGRDGA